jgi:hypothetical protein
VFIGYAKRPSATAIIDEEARWERLRIGREGDQHPGKMLNQA